MIDPARRLLITDLDNTLWDWFEAWYESFSALRDGLVELSGVDRALLEEQIRSVHQQRGTTEYSNLVREVPTLVAAAAPRDPVEAFDEALHAQSSRRKATTRLYPGVGEGLRALKRAGVRIAAYTESGAYWTEWRIRHTGLDGVIDVLYSSPDHDVIAGNDIAALRTGHYDPSNYGLRGTKHLHVPYGVLKPNQEILRVILDEQGCGPDETAYLGDSLMKDIAMAQTVGVLDIHAHYGLAQHRGEYDLLRRVTHWTNRDVAREKALARPGGDITPTLVPRRVCRSPAGLRPRPGRFPMTGPGGSLSGSDGSDDAASELTRDQQVGHYIDMWKQSVAVQMHFNDIEWRIRGLALTVATLALGAAGVTAKDGTRVAGVSLGTLVIVIGLLLWYAFYFVDRVWYHPLLKAAVTHGTEIEDEIKQSLPRAGITATITARSEYQTSGLVKWFSRKPVMHSDDKLVWFYKVGAIALAAAAVALQVGALLGAEPSPDPASPTPTSTTPPQR